MEFPRQEYWNRLPFPPPGKLPDLGIKLVPAALQADSLPLSHLGSPYLYYTTGFNYGKEFQEVGAYVIELSIACAG